jgi:hypothetical protein
MLRHLSIIETKAMLYIVYNIYFGLCMHEPWFSDSQQSVVIPYLEFYTPSISFYMLFYSHLFLKIDVNLTARDNFPCSQFNAHIFFTS